MANHNTIVIGASAGGVAALQKLAAGLDRGLPAAIMVVIHLKGDDRNDLADILSRVGPLPATFAHDGQCLEISTIYLAPPDRHLLFDGTRLHLGVGPRENHARPAIDPLFRSAAACCGPRTIGVVLTGRLNDGSSGLRAIQRCGGLTVVQDPLDAAVPEMPRHALERVEADHVVPLEAMPRLLAQLVETPEGVAAEVADDIRLETAIALNGRSSMAVMEQLGSRSLLTCPDCHGVLWQTNDGTLTRFRCHVGHAYTSETLDVALKDDIGRALDTALRTIDERASLLRDMERQAREHHREALAKRWAERAIALEADAKVLRRAILAK